MVMQPQASRGCIISPRYPSRACCNRLHCNSQLPTPPHRHRCRVWPGHSTARMYAFVVSLFILSNTSLHSTREQPLPVFGNVVCIQEDSRPAAAAAEQTSPRREEATKRRRSALQGVHDLCGLDGYMDTLPRRGCFNWFENWGVLVRRLRSKQSRFLTLCSTLAWAQKRATLSSVHA